MTINLKFDKNPIKILDKILIKTSSKPPINQWIVWSIWLGIKLARHLKIPVIFSEIPEIFIFVVFKVKLQSQYPYYSRQTLST